MRESNTYLAFLSFADPDRPLVKALADLFAVVGERVFYAPIQLPRAGSPEWRNKIIEAIKSSSCFVPIYTRHSIRRPWVLYESGVADSERLQQFPARVPSVSISEIDYLPGRGSLPLVYDLSDRESLGNLITNVCMCNKDPESRREIEPEVRRTMTDQKELVDRIINLSKTRWVFIAGNTPKDRDQLTQLGWFKTAYDYECRLREFVETLSEVMLKHGFSISACPQVPSVGMNVINKVVTCLAEAEKDFPDYVNFRIGGIYPIDREARELKLTSTAKDRWLEHIKAFRSSYLADQEWLFLIGGNEGTVEEYVAAKKADVKIYAVPCFGGTAQKISDEGKASQNGPCRECRRKDGMCWRDGIEKIVRSLKQTEA